MTSGQPLHGPTRSGLHRIATHLLARRRFAVSGRFGLRASPGGFATPAFGDGPETLRVSGVTLVHERGGAATSIALVGSTLRDLATFAGADLEEPFTCGEDTPPLGEVDGDIDLREDTVSAIADWYDLGWRALDSVLADLPGNATPATIQLWPEHFDVGTNVAVASGARVNLGFSPGDAFEPEPYAYVGPWELAQLPGSAFWNAPFGAVLRRADLSTASDQVATGVDFLMSGIRLAACS